MQFVSAFLAAVGLVGTVLGIVSWYSSYAGTTRRRNSVLFTIIAAIIFFTCLFGYLSNTYVKNSSAPSNGNNNPPQSYTTPTFGIAKNSPVATTVPSPTPTSVPTATPTPFPQ